MTHWFDLEPVGADFFDTAPHIFTYSIDLTAQPDDVWAGLTADEPLSWCRLLTKVHYTSPRPYGVGTRRIAEVGGGAMQMREKFITWDDETRRHSFYVEQSNVPLFQSFAEDYRVDELAVGSRLQWTFAFSPRPKLSLAVCGGLPVNSLIFSSFVRDTKRHFGSAPRH